LRSSARHEATRGVKQFAANLRPLDILVAY
jgi:hypothetical protein